MMEASIPVVSHLRRLRAWALSWLRTPKTFFLWGLQPVLDLGWLRTPKSLFLWGLQPVLVLGQAGHNVLWGTMGQPAPGPT